MPIPLPRQARVGRVVQRIAVDVKKLRPFGLLPGDEAVVVPHVPAADDDNATFRPALAIQQIVPSPDQELEMLFRGNLALADVCSLLGVLLADMPQKARQRHESLTIGNMKKHLLDLRTGNDHKEIVSQTRGLVEVELHRNHLNLDALRLSHRLKTLTHLQERKRPRRSYLRNQWG
jgi:hypothetical protein